MATVADLGGIVNSAINERRDSLSLVKRFEGGIKEGTNLAEGPVFIGEWRHLPSVKENWKLLITAKASGG